MSASGETSAAGFDNHGGNLPAEMLPEEIAYGDIHFEVNAKAVVAHGQTISLPPGFTHAYLLAASADGDQKAAFRLGQHATDVTIQSWTGKIGQWDTRLWQQREEILPPRPDAPLNAPVRKRTATVYAGLTPGFVKPYHYSYLFAYDLDIPPGATTLTLPDNEAVRILAVTVSDEGPAIVPSPLR